MNFLALPTMWVRNPVEVQEMFQCHLSVELKQKFVTEPKHAELRTRSTFAGLSPDADMVELCKVAS